MIGEKIRLPKRKHQDDARNNHEKSQDSINNLSNNSLTNNTAKSNSLSVGRSLPVLPRIPLIKQEHINKNDAPIKKFMNKLAEKESSQNFSPSKTLNILENVKSLYKRTRRQSSVNSPNNDANQANSIHQQNDR